MGRRIERAVRLVVLNFLRLGQQVAVALRVLRRPLYVAGESADGIHRWLPAQRDDLGAIVVQIANRNQRTEIAWRRTVVGQAGVAHEGDVFIASSRRSSPRHSRRIAIVTAILRDFARCPGGVPDDRPSR